MGEIMRELLSVAAEVFGIISVIWTIVSVILIFLRKKILNFWYRLKYRKLKTNNSYILIVATKKNIDDAKAKIKSQSESSLPKLKGLPTRIVELPDNCTADTSVEMLDKIVRTRSAMAKSKKFDVHLFYAGPIVLTAWIGGFFYNKNKVYIYHKDTESQNCECWGSLR